MKTNTDQSIVKELSVTLLWLILVSVVSILAVFVIAVLVFHTNRVLPETGFVLFAATFIVIYFRLKRNGKSFTDIGLDKDSRIISTFSIGALIGTAIIALAFAVLLATGAISYGYNAFSSSLVLILAGGLGYTAIQAGTEEVLFRGYLLDILSKKGRGFAIILSSALFSIGHFWHGVNIIGWINIFLFGFIAAQMFYVFGSLWVPIGFHVSWNYFQKYIFDFPIYGIDSSAGFLQLSVVGNSAFTGGNYGPEGSLITTLLLLLAMGLLYPSTYRHANAT